MEAKHTPGPWFLNERYEAVTNKYGEFIAMWATDCGDPIAPEDLKLIAAAPDLLEAEIQNLEFLKWLATKSMEFNMWSDKVQLLYERIAKTESAIKKATE